MMNKKTLIFLVEGTSRFKGKLEAKKKTNQELQMEVVLIGFLPGKYSSCLEDLTEIYRSLC